MGFVKLVQGLDQSWGGLLRIIFIDILLGLAKPRLVVATIGAIVLILLLRLITKKA